MGQRIPWAHTTKCVHCNVPALMLSIFHSDMYAEPLQLTSGVIWTALNIDYPGHSFSHLGIFWGECVYVRLVCLGSETRTEGLNGRLPNQDLLNSFHIISRNTGVPALLYDNYDPNDGNWRDPLVILWLPSALRNNERVKDYAYRARNLFRHFSYQARGHPSGIHGLLHQYARLESLRVASAYCSQIPHRRFHNIRRSSSWSTWFTRNWKVSRSVHLLSSYSVLYRIVESTLRTCNNLLERLHASFFFYLLPEPESFTKIGNYLPSAVVISTALLFSGLRSWVEAGWVEVQVPGSKMKGGQTMKWERRSRPSLQAMFILLATHACGVPLYFISLWPIPSRLVRMSYALYLRRLTQYLSSVSPACAFRFCWLRGSSTKSIRTRKSLRLSGCS